MRISVALEKFADITELELAPNGATLAIVADRGPDWPVQQLVVVEKKAYPGAFVKADGKVVGALWYEGGKVKRMGW